MKPFVFRALAFLAPVLLLVGAAAAPVAAQSGHAGHSATAPAKADDLDLSGLTMESLQKEGKMVEVAPGTVQISPERQQLIGVRIGTVEKRPLQKVIRTNGRVEFDEKRLATISPKIGGWIEELYVDFTGGPVKKGAPLLTLYSPELVSTQEEYLAALRARQELAASPYPEVADSGNALVESARRRLRLWDISEEQIRELEQTGQVRKSLTLFLPMAALCLKRWPSRGCTSNPGWRSTSWPTCRWSGSSPTSTRLICRSSCWGNRPPSTFRICPGRRYRQGCFHLPLPGRSDPHRQGEA